ncbi:MAG: DUF3566 domain-containing protein [Streptosporangiales bacterium]|nr:DUF3566 domain-containing protein [Streptosporangiales bacterium]
MSDLKRFATRGTTATGTQGRSAQQGAARPTQEQSGQQGGQTGQSGGAQQSSGPQTGSQGKLIPTRTTGTQPRIGGGRSRAPRRAHLLLSRIDPWSVMKFSFVVSLVLFVVLFVAVAVLYSVLSAMGVFDSLISTARDLAGGNDTWDVATWLSAKTILGWTAVLGAVNVVLITALATLGGFVYNLVTSLVGGIEVTLSEAE